MKLATHDRIALPSIWHDATPRCSLPPRWPPTTLFHVVSLVLVIKDNLGTPYQQFATQHNDASTRLGIVRRSDWCWFLNDVVWYVVCFAVCSYLLCAVTE
jgi:hypothetical protein